jgi:hypothetical protein
MSGFGTTVHSLWEAGRIDNAKFQELGRLATNRELFMQDCLR